MGPFLQQGRSAQSLLVDTRVDGYLSITGLDNVHYTEQNELPHSCSQHNR